MDAVKNSAHEETVRYKPYTIPEMKIALRFQVLGCGEATTRSLDKAIMAPSLKTANSTISRVGKYLQHNISLQLGVHCAATGKHTTSNAAAKIGLCHSKTDAQVDRCTRYSSRTVKQAARAQAIQMASSKSTGNKSIDSSYHCQLQQNVTSLLYSLRNYQL